MIVSRPLVVERRVHLRVRYKRRDVERHATGFLLSEAVVQCREEFVHAVAVVRKEVESVAVEPFPRRPIASRWNGLRGRCLFEYRDRFVNAVAPKRRTQLGHEVGTAIFRNDDGETGRAVRSPSYVTLFL